MTVMFIVVYRWVTFEDLARCVLGSRLLLASPGQFLLAGSYVVALQRMTKLSVCHFQSLHSSEVRWQ